MRSVSVRACGAALLILLVAVTAVPVFADDPAGTVVPQGRIAPPVGIASEDEGPIHVPGGLTAEEDQGRILPQVGLTAEEPPSVWELFLVWLQTRIQPPVG